MADSKLNLPRITKDADPDGSIQRALDAVKNNLNNKTTLVLRGKSSPEGVVAAPLGTIYVNEDGGVNTSLYIKENDGAATTGWSPACTVYSTIIPAGMIYAYSGTVVPTDYLLCDGSAVSRTTYAELFANIGTIWGVGDGATTFNVPDFRGMFIRGAGTHGTKLMATGAAFDGGAVGYYVADKFQGHYHTTSAALANPDNNSATGAGRNSPQYTALVTSPITDGANGTPRTGAETKPASYSVKYIILTKSTTNPTAVTSSGGGGSSTYMVKVRSTDTTPDYLNNKLSATAPIVKTVLNSGANEVDDFSILDASTAQKGATRLSNSYVGTSTSLATTEKALSDGLATKITANAAIVGATKTKITYDANGLVTSGANAITSDIADTTDYRYCTDAQKVIIGNTSGTNTGDNAANSSSTYIGTTSVALNRASAVLALTGVSIDGSSGSCTGNAATSSSCSGNAATSSSCTGNAATATTAGTCSGNSATVTGATFTTALTVNTGTVTLTGNVLNTSVLTIGAGAVGVSGTNTGDVTLAATNHGLGLSGQVITLGTPSTCTASTTNAVTTTTHTHAITGFLTSLTGAVLTDQTAGQTIGATGTRLTKLWVTDITCTNSIGANITGSSASCTGNSATATKATNMVGGNSTTLKGTMYYQSNTDVSSTIAPNTAAAAKYLSMTGDGTNGAAPVWVSLTTGGDTVAPATNTADYIPQWNGANSKTLKDGLAVPVGGLAIPAGSVIAWAGASIPTGYLDCNGAAVSRSTYAALFTAISTTWGVGDNSTTFNVPDLRSATVRGVGTPTLYTSNTVIALAATVDDKFQGHFHDSAFSIANPDNASATGTGRQSPQYTNTVRGAITDGTNGSPRTGLETTGKARGAYWIIKY